MPADALDDGRLSIDPTLLRQLIEDQFPRWAAEPIEPIAPGGWDNRSFRLGQDKLVRMPSAARYAPQVAKEHRILPFLASRLSLDVPQPLALGEPGAGYPYQWSVYRWIDGETVPAEPAQNDARLAADLASFLREMHALEAEGGPLPGPENFHRGGDFRIYEAEARNAIRRIGATDLADLERMLDKALETSWSGPPVWVHGDLACGNLLLRDGRLCAVIDFGSCAVGDPACDLAIAWTLFDAKAAQTFRSLLSLDDDVWARARGWTVWKAAITLAAPIISPQQRSLSVRTLRRLLATAL